MLGLPITALSELFPEGWTTLYIQRELPIQQYESLAVFAICSLAAIGIYINTARAQLRLHRADPDARPVLHVALVQSSKQDTNRIRVITLIVLFHALFTWVFDIFLALYMNWSAFDTTTSSTPESGDISPGLIVVAVAVGALLAIPLVLIIFVIIPLGQITLFSRTLASYARRHGRDSLDALLPGCRILAAHAGLMWTLIAFAVISFLPVVNLDGTLVPWNPWVMQLCCFSSNVWTDVVKRLMSVEKGVADLEFCKELLDVFYVRWVFGKRSLAPAKVLGEDALPPAPVDEKAVLLVEV